MQYSQHHYTWGGESGFPRNFPEFDQLEGGIAPSSGGVRKKETPFSNVSRAALFNAVLLFENGFLTKKLQPFKDSNKTIKSRISLEFPIPYHLIPPRSADSVKKSDFFQHFVLIV